MNLELSEDQAALAGALDRMLREWAEAPLGEPFAYIESEALEAALVEGGYLDVAREGFGVMGAVQLIQAVGRTPYAVELTATALVASVLGLTDLPRPLAMIDAGSRRAAVRFLAPGGGALVDAGDHLRLLRCDERVTAVNSFLAFPFGRFDGDAVAASEPVAGVDVAVYRTLQRIGVAAELIGAMDRALDITVGFVKQREQFGQAIGSFQAVGHRLSECASIVHGAKLLLDRAALSEGDRDATMALTFAQDAAKRLIWETNQLHGAVALTLEYPLHYWNYRLRALHGEMGGPSAAATALAHDLWAAHIAV